MSGIPLDYRSSGVDIDAADDSKNRIARHVMSTTTAGAFGKFGAFGGMFRMPAGYESPLLVSSADGVGTKIKIAIESGRNDTIGHCLVNHCTNDILVQGAVPLFFLDYVAFGKLEPTVAESIVAGVAAGCRENGAALVGGETAEMPGIYTPPDYDLAGFIVGVVEESKVLGAERVQHGDVLIGLASSGLHTNGYSLARRIVAQRLQLSVHDVFPESGGATVADVMLAVHRSYLACLRPVLDRIHALAHITGGGLPGNVDRVLPLSADAEIDVTSWSLPSLFKVLGEAGEVRGEEMFRAFNMGIGMVVITSEEHAFAVHAHAHARGIDSYDIGRIVSGSGKVNLSGMKG